MIRKNLRPLVEWAKKAQKRAYCPYSRYAVGAAVLTESGRIFPGANVENASYGLSLCAERVAIFNAVARGEKSLKAICVAGRSAKPCGACRQVMLEFSSKDTQLLLVNLNDAGRRDSVTQTRVYSMLPSPFDPLDSGLIPPNPQNLLKRRQSRRARPAKRRRKARRERVHKSRRNLRRGFKRGRARSRKR